MSCNFLIVKSSELSQIPTKNSYTVSQQLQIPGSQQRDFAILAAAAAPAHLQLMPLGVVERLSLSLSQAGPMGLFYDFLYVSIQPSGANNLQGVENIKKCRHKTFLISTSCT